MRRWKSTFVASLCVVGAFNLGCNYKQMVINSSYLMVDEAIISFFAEPDTQLAAQAAPANLKLLEGMAKGAPENADIQLATAQLYGMYALGFLEDSTADEDAQEAANARAAQLYLRAFGYAQKALQQQVDFKSMMTMDIEQFREALKHFEKEDVPALFWAAFNWGLYINMSRSDLQAIGDLPKVQAMANRIIELDERYYYGGAHLILMVYNGVLGPAMGGNPKMTKQAYYKAWRISGRKFLMTKYLFARYYCLQTQNRWYFEKLLNEIIDAPDNLLESQSLANALAKEKAARLLAQVDDLF
ncbi:MAG: hypothetical protein JXX14_04490 [Deltaproteobacteria bacterium]|nr:hypothetical protein [Deltaproteobacteria bacterium]